MYIRKGKKKTNTKHSQFFLERSAFHLCLCSQVLWLVVNHGCLSAVDSCWHLRWANWWSAECFFVCPLSCTGIWLSDPLAFKGEL